MAGTCPAVAVTGTGTKKRVLVPGEAHSMENLSPVTNSRITLNNQQGFTTFFLWPKFKLFKVGSRGHELSHTVDERHLDKRLYDTRRRAVIAVIREEKRSGYKTEERL